MRPFLFLLLFVFAGALSAAEPAVEATVHWGFDGRVVPGRTALLAIELANPGERAREGIITVRPSGFGSGPEPVVASCFLSPRSRRVIQVAVEIGQYPTSWTVGGNLLAKDLSLDPPAKGSLAKVVLLGEDLRTGRPPVVPYAEDRFPASFSLCDGLGLVVLDHVPRRWSPEQRLAFRDWVVAGGELHLVLGPDGRPVVFSGDLALLNDGDGDGIVGGGRIIRHDRPLIDLRPVDVGEVPPSDAPAAGTATDAAVQTQLAAEEFQNWYPRLEDQANEVLGSLARPDHPWKLINLLLFAFVILAALGPWWFGRKGRGDWRKQNLALVVLMGLTAWSIAVLGRRGYGEAATFRSIALAHHLGDGAVQVREWGLLFVTASGQVEVRHAGGPQASGMPAGHQFYQGHGDAPDGEGRILLDAPGGYFPSLPLYSSRLFFHQGRMELGSAGAVSSAVTSNREEPVAGTPLPPALKSAVVLSAWIANPAGIAIAAQTSGHLVVTGPVEPKKAFQERAQRFQGQFYGGRSVERDEQARRDHLLHLAEPVVLDDLRRDDPARHPGVRRCYVTTLRPSALDPVLSLPAQQTGVVVHRFDVADPTAVLPDAETSSDTTKASP